jgi:hypothetical protein
MANAISRVHRCASRAHLWIPAPCGDPDLCVKISTFPLMTTGTFSDILESDPAARTAPVWVRKGRYHEKVFEESITGRAVKRTVVFLLRRSIPCFAQFQQWVVSGIPAAIQYESGDTSVSELPPTRHGTSHRSRCQRSSLGAQWANCSPNRPALHQLDKESREGQDQASRLTCPSLFAWADGYRNNN